MCQDPYPLDVIGISSSSSTASRCLKNCRREFRREFDEFVGVDDDRPEEEELSGRREDFFILLFSTILKSTFSLTQQFLPCCKF
jgi:hypothetical protein